jgi:hypothetical protein
VKTIKGLFSFLTFISLALNPNEMDRKSKLFASFHEAYFSGKYICGEADTSPGAFDIIINELMPDPSPAVLLPEYEYLELYNRTQGSILLDHCTLEIGTRIFTLSGRLEAGTYLIVCHSAATDLFEEYGQVLGLFTSSTTLVNSGQLIILKNASGEIIDALHYSDKWYKDNYKAEGGWSLERIDPENLCAEVENWTASISIKGGSPGAVNSVRADNPDRMSPFVSSIDIISDYEIRINFNEPIKQSFFAGQKTFQFLNSVNKIIGIFPELPFYKSVRIEFQNRLVEGKLYEILVNNEICDCSGNKFPEPLIIPFGMPSEPQFTDIILTEILYAPYPSCPEFVEIYCNSDRLLDLSDLVIGINYGESQNVKREIVSESSKLIFPGQYLALTIDPEMLANFYDLRNPAALLIVKELPALRNEGGCIELTNRSLQIIDRYCYSKASQYPLLNSDQGVSLERVNIDRKPGFESSWHSASSVSGFATPGYRNSQSAEIQAEDKFLAVSPKTFTPDNDGHDDIACISYSLGKEGFAGNIIIFDAHGRQVCHLHKNELLGSEGIVYWDGLDDRGILCQTGLYLVFFDAFHLNGERIRRKEVLLLLRSRGTR